MTDPIIPPYEPKETRTVDGGYVLAEQYPDAGEPVWQAEVLKLREELATERLKSEPLLPPGPAAEVARLLKDARDENARLRQELIEARKPSPVSEAVEVADRGPKVEPVEVGICAKCGRMDGRHQERCPNGPKVERAPSYGGPTDPAEFIKSTGPAVEPIHRHRCMRCSEEFDCRNPGMCAAGYDVLPLIVNRDGTGYEEHCPRTAATEKGDDDA